MRTEICDCLHQFQESVGIIQIVNVLNRSVNVYTPSRQSVNVAIDQFGYTS